MKFYSKDKLMALAEDFFMGACTGLLNKKDILECILEEKVRLSIESLELMAHHKCRKKGSDVGCDQVLNLNKIAKTAMRYIKSGRKKAVKNDDTWTSDDSSLHAGDLNKAQQHAEDKLQDEPNSYTKNLSPQFDALVDLLLTGSFNKDKNNDKVADADRDGDGLPNTIEDGLDALRSILTDIENNEYRGHWDRDGDGKQDIDAAVRDEGDAEKRSSSRDLPKSSEVAATAAAAAAGEGTEEL